MENVVRSLRELGVCLLVVSMRTVDLLGKCLVFIIYTNFANIRCILQTV